MGCDIHGWIEVNHNGKWVAHSELPDAAQERNYQRYTLLASVRGCSERIPLGLPEDISETVQFHSDSWGVDGHSHSYMNADQFASICTQTVDNPKSETWWNPYNYLGIDIEGQEKTMEDYRVVFWFDN